MFKLILGLFDTDGFPPRWHCGTWSDGLGWLHVGSDVGILLAYLAIPAVLVRLAAARPEMPFGKVFWLFSAFIVCCGFTHGVDALIFWQPIYRFSGVLKFVTAVVSWTTVVALFRIVPQVYALRTPGELQREVERKTKELSESEERFRTAFEYAPVGVAYVKLDGSWLWVNERLCELLGYERHELAQLTFQDVTHPDDLEQDLGLIQQVLRGDRSRYSMEKRYISKGGHIVWAKLSVTLMRDEAGAPLHFVSVVDDISLERELAETVETKTRELERSNRELETFAYSVSHDLRAPVRAIRGFTEILVNEYAPQLDDEAKRIISIVQQSTQRMGEMIEALLRLSQYGRQPLKLETVDMQTLVASLLETATLQMSGRELDAQVDPLPEVVCDASLLKHVWENLISNALKYSRNRKRTEITIQGKTTPGFVEYSIRDNGIGFDGAQAEHMFVVFKRLCGREFEGNGAGLAIVKQIVERHGGEVGATGQPDAGATLWFTLPSTPQGQSGSVRGPAFRPETRT